MGAALGGDAGSGGLRQRRLGGRDAGSDGGGRGAVCGTGRRPPTATPTADTAGARPVVTANRRETVDAKIARLYERNGAAFGARSAEDYLAKVTAFTDPAAGGHGHGDAAERRHPAVSGLDQHLRRGGARRHAADDVQAGRRPDLLGRSRRRRRPTFGQRRSPELIGAMSAQTGRQAGGVSASVRLLRRPCSRIRSSASFCWRLDSWGPGGRSRWCSGWREVVVEAPRRRHPRPCPAGAAQALEEVADVDLEEAGDVPELGRRNAVGALLVFLDLLEGQAQGPSEIALIIAQADALLAHPSAHMAVHRMGTVLALPLAIVHSVLRLTAGA